MEKKKLSFKHIVIIITISLILAIVVIFLYSKMVKLLKDNNLTINKEEIFIKENKNHIFKISQIILYSNVDVIDSSEKKTLQDLSLSQYTDMAIYIDNKNYIKELTAENTISQMYIDNIVINENSDLGTMALNYKDVHLFGKYRTLENNSEKIVFNVLHTNDEKKSADYSNPVFYTDCSEPITIGFVNKNIVTNYYIRANEQAIAFNGSILKRANISLDLLKTQIDFCIHIKNNMNEEFVCNVSIDNSLDNDDGGLYTGYIMKIFDISEDEYNFVRLVD